MKDLSNLTIDIVGISLISDDISFIYNLIKSIASLVIFSFSTNFNSK